MNARAWLPFTTGLFLVAGCTDGGSSRPLDSETAALTATTNVEDALVGLADALTFLDDSDLLDLALGADEATGSVEPPVPGEEAGDEGVGDDLDAEARDLAEWLRTHVFVEENLEEETGTSVTYRLRAETVCAVDDPELDEPDDDCVDALTRAELRLRVTSPAAGDVDVTLLVGPERHAPVTFYLHRASMAVGLELAAAGRAVTYLADALADEGEDPPYLPEVMEGRVRVELVKNGGDDYTARLVVEADVRVVATVDGERYEASLDASDPTIEVRVNGAARELRASVNLGPFSVALPLDAVAGDWLEDPETGEPRALHGTLRAAVGGLTGATVFRGETDRFEVTGLGLGETTSTVTVDGETLLALDLNALSGRRFDLTVDVDDEDQVRVGVEPVFDAALRLRFEVLADQLLEGDVPDGALHDDLRVGLVGEAPAIRVVEGSDEGGAGGLEVLSGTLLATSASYPESNLEVTAGMCLVEGDAEEDAPSLLASFAEGTCGG